MEEKEKLEEKEENQYDFEYDYDSEYWRILNSPYVTEKAKAIYKGAEISPLSPVYR